MVRVNTVYCTLIGCATKHCTMIDSFLDSDAARPPHIRSLNDVTHFLPGQTLTLICSTRTRSVADIVWSYPTQCRAQSGCSVSRAHKLLNIVDSIYTCTIVYPVV